MVDSSSLDAAVVGISVRPTEQDAAASYKLVWRQFNVERLRHHNLVLVVALHGTFDGDRARPVMTALAREVLAGTPR